MWQEILFLIPKNLVYIFVGIIVFAFLAMMYITYTDRNMTEFLTYDRTREVVVVDPLFVSLQKSMDIQPQAKVAEIQAASFDLKKFNTRYLRKNKPIVMRQQCAGWGASKHWTVDYLINKGATSQILYS
jgi:hypothetical protein